MAAQPHLLIRVRIAVVILLLRGADCDSFLSSYARYEVLSGFVNAVFLVVIGLFVFLEAVHRIVRPPELNRYTSQKHLYLWRKLTLLFACV